MSPEERNGYVVKTVFWTLILCSFAFTAGSYAFTCAAGVKIADGIVDNDRIRQSDKDAIQIKLDRMQSDITDIKVSIAKIK